MPTTGEVHSGKSMDAAVLGMMCTEVAPLVAAKYLPTRSVNALILIKLQKAITCAVALRALRPATGFSTDPAVRAMHFQNAAIPRVMCSVKQHPASRRPSRAPSLSWSPWRLPARAHSAACSNSITHRSLAAARPARVRAAAGGPDGLGGGAAAAKASSSAGATSGGTRSMASPRVANSAG